MHLYCALEQCYLTSGDYSTLLIFCTDISTINMHLAAFYFLDSKIVIYFLIHAHHIPRRALGDYCTSNHDGNWNA